LCVEKRGRVEECSVAPLRDKRVKTLCGCREKKVQTNEKIHKYINYTINLVDRLFGRWRRRRLCSGCSRRMSCKNVRESHNRLLFHDITSENTVQEYAFLRWDFSLAHTELVSNTSGVCVKFLKRLFQKLKLLTCQKPVISLILQFHVYMNHA
jgi:hypothetical protein